MRVEGDDAKGYCAVRLDSYATVNKGDLVMADDVTGEVKWLDSTGKPIGVTLGQHAIRITSARR